MNSQNIGCFCINRETGVNPVRSRRRKALM